MIYVAAELTVFASKTQRAALAAGRTIQRNLETSPAILRDRKVTSRTAKNTAARHTLAPIAGDCSTVECVKFLFAVYPGDMQEMCKFINVTGSHCTLGSLLWLLTLLSLSKMLKNQVCFNPLAAEHHEVCKCCFFCFFESFFF